MALKLDTRAEVSSEGANTYELKGRPSKVSVEAFKEPFAPGGTFADFLGSLPGFLSRRSAELAGCFSTAGTS